MAFCSSCGKELVSEVRFCPECGAATSEGAGRDRRVDPAREAENDQPPVEESAVLRQRDSSAVRPEHESVHPREGREAHVENHLAKAIIATLMCCLPLGIIAIVHASSVDGKVQAGDSAGARLASRKANDWGNYAIISGAIVIGLYVMFLALLGASGF